jgi:hypothetical protein
MMACVSSNGTIARTCSHTRADVNNPRQIIDVSTPDLLRRHMPERTAERARSSSGTAQNHRKN